MAKSKAAAGRKGGAARASAGKASGKSTRASGRASGSASGSASAGGSSGASSGASSGGGGRARANAYGSRRGLGKGEALEVGTPQHDSAAAGPVRRTATKRPAGKTSLQLPGEKAVKKTNRALPVEPRREAPGDREPMPPEALDHRRQIVGTDDKGRGGRR